VATVSHVLNNTRFVSEELRGRVNKAIEDLDYHPNVMAGSLRSRKTKTIGLIIPDNSNPLFAAISRSIEQVSSDLNYTVMLCNSSYSLENELRYINVLRSKSVDGIIILPTTTIPDHLNQLVENMLPVIVLHHIIPKFKTGFVLVDNFKGAYDAAIHLIELGHKNIGYIDRPVVLPHSLERLNGFKQALKDHNIEIDEDVIIQSKGFGYKDGFETMEELLRRNHPLTALMAFNDITAIGAMETITDHGLKVPDDISVVGFDDIDICSFIRPRLTTIHFPKYKIAEYAVKMLLKKINNPEKIKDFEKKVLPLRLIVRDSTAKAKK